MQTSLDFTPRTHGGARKGAGRPKSKTRRDPPHRSRPVHVDRHPVHVVMRAVPEVGRLRTEPVYDAVRAALDKIAERTVFRVVHFSLQHNHIHLIVEADDSAALESGMRALAISLARRINKALDRKGKVFEFRYHTTALRSPTQTRRAISYVLNNWRRHNEDERSLDARSWTLDRYSSAITFTGWANWSLRAWPASYVALPVARPQTWLLEKGWLRGGKPIRTDEVPGPLR
jgi:REP element-mobilizing transposase RayT